MKNIVLTTIILAVTLVSAQAPKTERDLEKAFVQDMQILTADPGFICNLLDKPRCIEYQSEIVNNLIMMFENKQYGTILTSLDAAETVMTTKARVTSEEFWKNPFIFLIYIILLAGK